MRPLAVVTIIMALSATACQRSAAPAPREQVPAINKAGSNTGAPGASNAAARSAPSSAVTRVVFLDKEEACACDKKRAAASWKALKDVIGTSRTPAVERVHVDTQPLLAAPVKAKRATMVLPGVYFLGKDDKLLTLLQGEVTAEQIKKALR